MSEVRLEGLTKEFKDAVAVDNLTLTVEEGEFFSLLGPSGCGKTTTLRMIGGFEEPTEGQVFLGEDDVTTLAPYRRNVNTVFQSYALFPHLNVADNVAFGLKRKRVDSSEIKRRVEETLELVDLEGYGSRRPSQLSGGQQQRVALGRALVNRPAVLLLDEPLGALDLKLRKQMQLELKRIQSEVGITFVYVTHDQEEAMTMSNRLAVMRAGRIEQLGSPQEVYENPKTAFVAGFLGASNLLDGKIKERGGDFATVEVVGGSLVTVPIDRLDGSGENIRLGVRPEKILLQTSAALAAHDYNTVEGTLEISTFVGVSRQFTVRGPGGNSLVVYEQNVGSEVAPDPGQTVWLSWAPEHTFAVAADDTETQGGQEGGSKKNREL